MKSNKYTDMKKIVKETVKDLLSTGEFIDHYRYVVYEGNPGTYAGDIKWCQATYIDSNFVEKDAIFYDLNIAIEFCKGNIGVISKNVEKVFNDSCNEIIKK